MKAMLKRQEKLKDEVLRTNPVWSVERILEQWKRELFGDPGLIRERFEDAVVMLHENGITLPREFLHGMADAGILSVSKIALGAHAPRRVCGLTVIPNSRDALIVPLKTLPSREWGTSPLLPFEPWQLRSLLLHLLLSTDFVQRRGVPERFSFFIQDSVGRDIKGDSMTIAGLLSVIDSHNGCENPVFDSAVAVVQPAADNSFRSVRFVREKLEAFRRECGRGGLLVRHPNCSESERYQRCFEHTASVKNLSELARFLLDLGVLDGFVNTAPLSSGDTANIVATLTQFEQDYEQERILDLASRTEQCGYQAEVPYRLRVDVRWAIANTLRHSGDMLVARKCAAKVLDSLTRCGSTASYSELVLAAARLAAAFYDLHDFERAEAELLPWAQKIGDDPMIASMQSRVELLNTLGRVYGVLGKGGWQELFEQVMALQSQADPSSLPMTRNFLIGELIRDDQLDQAEQRIGDPTEAPSPIERAFNGFYRATIARKRKVRWKDSYLDSLGRIPGIQHPLGFYQQAVARQPGVSDEEFGSRMFKASQYFAADMNSSSQANLLDLLRLVTAYCSLARGNHAGASQRLDEIVTFVDQEGMQALRVHYSPYLDGLRHGDTEGMLRQVPYFLR